MTGFSPTALIRLSWLWLSQGVSMVDPEESEVVIVITSWQIVYIVRSVMDSNNYER